MKNIIFVIASLLISIGIFGQPTPPPDPNPPAVQVNPTATQNYVHKIVYKKGVQQSNLGLVDGNDKIESISYFDGLGRPVQSIAIRQGGGISDDSDIISTIVYDQYGRQIKNYLPYAGHLNNGKYVETALEDTDTYFTTKYADDLNILTPNPYSEKEFEPSPLNRVKKQAAPGEVWKLGNGNEIEFDYQSNITSEVKLYNVTLSTDYTPTLNGGTADYNASELYKTITKDENHDGTTTKNHTTEEFKDKQGRVLLKRTYADINGISTAHDTYYVYDDYGNLTYVLPPKAEADNGIPSSTLLNELCYQYKYDKRNRLIEKKIPGKDWEYIVYNKLDQPIMTQDANLKAQNKWLFTKYDAFGRVAYTGIYKSNSSRSDKQVYADGQTNLYENKGSTFYNYTNNVFPTGITSNDILTVNYYDDYNFDNDGLVVPTNTTYDTTINGTNMKGLATGSKIKVLGTTSWITTVTGYDEHRRPIWIGTKNNYLSTTDYVETKLKNSTDDISGLLREVKTTHKKTGELDILTIDTYTYDHSGKVLSQTSKINNQAIESIAENTYDELGQLTAKEVGGTVASELQMVNYKYNIRGWLTDINDVNNIGTIDLFAFKIDYNDGTIPLYNGNITSTEWKTKSINNTSNPISTKYNYTYDALNRITAASGANTSYYNLTSVAYDKNGNIQNLVRNGHTDVGVTNFGVMDNLSYYYSGNQLHSVSDSSGKITGFNDGNSSDAIYDNGNDDYSYDVNGNMISDANKGITAVEYNHLNMPTKFTVAGTNAGILDYTYSADGIKLQKKKTQSGLITTTDYAGNYVYENDVLQFFNTSEGYVQNTNGVFSYVYQYLDHLGNVRLSYADSDGNGTIAQSEIIKENNYYPFGLKHKGYNDVTQSTGNSVANKFGYNGVELEEALGLDMYETGYRQYDPALGRFFTIDPLTEVVPAINPYQFSFNNPVYFSDPSGLMDDNFLQDLWDKTPNDGLIHHYDSSGNQTGTTDPDEIAKSENRHARGAKATSKDEQSYFNRINRENNYLNTRGLRGTPDFLSNLVLNGGLNALEIAEIAKLRTTLVKNLKAQYMMAIFSPDIVADILFIGLGSGSSGLRNKTFNYVARGESYAAIGATGKIGERALKLLGGTSQKGFSTTTGWRFIDQFVKGAAFESKVGYTTLTKSIARQITKDVELINRGRINSSTWHFFKSPVTGKIGASKPLLEALKTAGIKTVIH